AGKRTAQLKFCSSRQSNDSLYLQFALAARSSVFSAGLSDQNVPAWRLPSKVRTALGNLQRGRSPAPGGAKIDMVARGQRRRSWRRTKTRWRAAPPPARSALRFDDYYDDWLFLCRQQRGRLDRGHVQPARFLANHAPGVFDYPAGPDRSDRG